MADREKVIKGLETIKQFFGYGLPSTAEMFDSYCGTLNDAIAKMKELPVWHVFNVREPDEDEKKEHPDWKWVMESDLTPNHGEEFIWYRRSLNFFVIDSWNDDMWEEYCSTADGETIEAGDAWMELPKPPEHKLNENR